MKASVLRSFVLTGLAAVLALSALCQTGGTGSGQTAPCRVTSDRPLHLQPYTAEFKITNVQVLGDGTTITRESKETSARDAQGRTFNQTSNNLMTGQDQMVGFTSGHVQDSVGGIQINWNSQNKKATVLKGPSGDQRHGCWKSESGDMTWNFGPMPKTPRTSGGSGNGIVQVTTTLAVADVPRPSTEDLGTAMIQGVEAHGTRTTTTTPAGRIGNDKPIVHTFEHWTAQDFGLVVREVTNDPQFGKRTKELVSLTQGEPDPALFEPPQGYEVVNEEMHEVPCEQM